MTSHKGETLPARNKNEAMIESRPCGSFKASTETAMMEIWWVVQRQTSIAHCTNEKEMENKMLEERIRAVPVKIREGIETTISSKKHLSAHSMNEDESMNKEMLEKKA